MRSYREQKARLRKSRVLPRGKQTPPNSWEHDMTIIKATCPVCGDVQLSRDQVRLVLHPVRDRSFYSFTCNVCEDEVRKPAGPEVVRLLRMGGVVPESADFPAEAAEEHHGPSLTRDDLLDFVTWLNSATAIAAAAGAGLHRRLLEEDDSVHQQP